MAYLSICQCKYMLNICNEPGLKIKTTHWLSNVSIYADLNACWLGSDRYSFISKQRSAALAMFQDGGLFDASVPIDRCVHGPFYCIISMYRNNHERASVNRALTNLIFPMISLLNYSGVLHSHEKKNFCFSKLTR